MKINLTTTYKEQYNTKPTAQQQSITDDRVEFNISFDFNRLLLYPTQERNIHLYRNPSNKYSKQHIHESSKTEKNTHLIMYPAPILFLKMGHNG